ncbi:MAG: dihydropteroate synthase [Thermodesulfovibrionales bacterium]|nr:dihydropteroate synthase [Thermodesulfovibrionales bacterium]
MRLRWRHFDLDLSSKTHVMGILNVTPDSFSDGGLFSDPERAVEHALRMVEDGADIIDIGGESTRPGSEPVSAAEEIKRVVPVIKRLVAQVKVPVSIDTYKSLVARAALDAGASMVNDISGLRFDPEMKNIVAEYRVPVIIMHIKGIPKTMQLNPTYDALIPEIMDYLREGIIIAREAGISEELIIIDPGIGFGKTFEHNLEIINRLREFTYLEKPILIGPSRKAFIGKLLGDVPPLMRLEGTLGAVAIAAYNGANIVRVHDVKETVKLLKVVDGIKKENLLVFGRN